MSMNKSFAARLSRNIIVTTSILFLLAILVAGVSSHYIIADEATKSTEHLLEATMSDMEVTLKDVEGSVKSASWLIEEHLDDKDYLYHITKNTVSGNDHIVGSAIAFIPNYFDGLYYFSPYSYLEGDKLCSKQLGNSQYDYFYMDWFQIPYLLGEPCWSEPYYDEGGAESLISTYSFPLKDADGKVYAIVTADVSLEWITELISGIKPYPNSNVTLVSRSGAYINVGKDSRLTGETIWSTLRYQNADDVNLTKIAEAMMNGEKGVMQYKRGKKISFAVFGPISNGWMASMTCDYKDVLRRASQMHAVLILIFMFGIIILLGVCMHTVQRMTRPLSDFSESAMSIAGGNFNTPLPEIKSEDEIRTLRDSFDCMQRSINEYINDLKSTTAAKERFESELNIANKIQMAMLPKDFPNDGRIELGAFLTPAREVGGDFYDFQIRGKYLYFTIGDVSGKGVPASLFMAITKASFSFISGLDMTLDNVVGKMNDAVSEGNANGLFVTVFAGKLDLETGELTYCNAGHNPIVVIPPEDDPYFLDVKPNIAIGVFPGFQYVKQTVILKKGTRLVLYTDGVTEAERADKSQFGEDRLLAWASSSEARECSAEDMCTHLYDAVRAFADGNEQNDDITMMTVNLK